MKRNQEWKWISDELSCEGHIDHLDVVKEIGMVMQFVDWKQLLEYCDDKPFYYVGQFIVEAIANHRLHILEIEERQRQYMASTEDPLKKREREAYECEVHLESMAMRGIYDDKDVGLRLGEIFQEGGARLEALKAFLGGADPVQPSAAEAQEVSHE